MTQEEMQKAASDSVHDTIGFVINEYDINFEENNYEAGRRDALFDYGSVLFTDGAKWRINSVWHDASELPTIDNTDIVIAHNNQIRSEFWCNFVDWDKFVRTTKLEYWAYVKDLLPIKEDGK